MRTRQSPRSPRQIASLPAVAYSVPGQSRRRSDTRLQAVDADRRPPEPVEEVVRWSGWPVREYTAIGRRKEEGIS